ncbi:RsmB/NOP family class I SAM-dependent RNA methyltransferase [Phaeovulum vinaykumarii]|uniref:16S rRNA (Cytosine967-C5)-methyltransferase n=1 Tax=Phaeovulum vinaykumarii TaxID=407234 RepID=A0A1N7KYP3_9RHOB|nr:methyltransferase domain-containing protein [Phaeovulum vinaykumarii]SIS66616.1 16S rRNA (cytosine967-C5)-methyltransferase [Phaeovulum vinaykumarii]SOC01025.1 16S rRNA (cytosine967-C5)-methyltransferase [Phaeovulum vinaykumarii]
MARKDPVRAAALGLLDGVWSEGRSLSDQIETEALAALAPPDRARAQRLAVLALREAGRIDRLLKPHLRKAPPSRVQALLRLAGAEMLAGGGAAHGVVDAAVALAPAAQKGLVNALARKLAGAGDAHAALPAPELPGWLRGRLMSAHGKAAVQRMEAAHLRGAPLDLTPRNGDAAALAARLAGQGIAAEALPTGSVRLAVGGQVSDLPGFDAGDWWVQDAAAALPARALGVGPGQRVLDLCAAPGGKTLQLAATGAEVTALDISEARLARLRANLARCGLEARIVAGDALDWTPEAPFDAILLDAPCSATGTIRRHPDLPYLRDPARLREIFALQAALIDRAAGWLRPGGRMVFSTCSLLPEEGEAQARAALERHPELTAQPIDLPGLAPEWHVPEGLRLRPDFWPERGGMDGFFVALWQHAGPARV